MQIHFKCQQMLREPGNNVGQGTITLILSTTSFQTDVNKCMFLCSFPWEKENAELK